MSEKFNPNTGADTSITIRFPDSDGNLSSETPRFSVGYWSIRGLGAPLRMMLSAAKVDHVVLLHDIVEDDDTDGWGWKSAYFQHKPDIVKDYNQFMNLPYLIDYKKEILVCQTNAIFNYLGRELAMCGSTSKDAVKCDELLCEVYDLRNLIVQFSYASGGTKEEAENLVKDSKKHLLKFNNYLATLEGKPCHLIGGKFTAPDFHLFEMIDQLDGLCKEFELEDILKDYSHVREFKNSFENLSENSFYLKQSTLHTELPYNNCMSKFASHVDAKVFKRGQDAPWRNKGNITISCDDGRKK